ncbi:hypothetical protein Nepgr_022920 [Nepenthes gracilis]|uniref:Uncharacterized protein n=1 Tax=Nepenthes gracilis TaxID=150966 RepID=A0AAD3SZW6_NEPGR|nr:hypothetical protein Nepgr_022920 [Nepenthes gracilis]
MQERQLQVPNIRAQLEAKNPLPRARNHKQQEETLTEAAPGLHYISANPTAAVSSSASSRQQVDPPRVNKTPASSNVTSVQDGPDLDAPPNQEIDQKVIPISNSFKALQVDDRNDYLECPDLAPAAHPMGDGPILPPSHELSSLDKSSGEIPNGLPLSSCLDVGGMSSSASDPSPSPKSNTSSPKSLTPASCLDNNVKQCPPPILESVKVASPRAKSNKHHAPWTSNGHKAAQHGLSTTSWTQSRNCILANLGGSREEASFVSMLHQPSTQQKASAYLQVTTALGISRNPLQSIDRFLPTSKWHQHQRGILQHRAKSNTTSSRTKSECISYRQAILHWQGNMQ